MSTILDTGFSKEASRCRIEAGFDIPFQYPLRSGAVREHRRALLHCVRTTPFLPKPVRVWVGQCFGNGVQSVQIQGLHGYFLHCQDTQRTFLPVGFRDVHASQREGFVTSSPHLVYGHSFAFRVFPEDFIDPRSVLAWVFCHSSYSKGLAAKRMGQQVLQGVHLVPLTGLRCLNDTRLQPTHRLVDRLPWDGMPVCREVGGSTSRKSAVMCIAPLIGSSRSLVHPHRREVCPLARRVMLQPVSVPLQDGFRFFPPPYPHHRWLALQLSYLQGRSDTGLPRSTRLTVTGEVLSIRR